MRLLVPLVLATIAAGPVLGHEFWIEPENFQVKSGETVIANFRNGQEFRGAPLSWFERRTRRSETRINGAKFDYLGRDGDQPAVTLDATQDGLLSIIHETKRSRITYQEPEKFDEFVAHKDLDISAHPSPNYPLTEGYTRYAKSLVSIGTGTGSDAATGLEIEFVAQSNPYTDDLNGAMVLQLLYQGNPRADAQVEIFERNPSGEVEISLTRTDSGGLVSIPVKAGHDYLIDSVLLRSRPEEKIKQDGMIWDSLWASLTFAIPD